MLGLDASVSLPSVPVDDSGMILAQRYDVPETMRALGDMLRQHGYALRVNGFQQGPAPIRCLWVRRLDGDR